MPYRPKTFAIDVDPKVQGGKVPLFVGDIRKQTSKVFEIEEGGMNGYAHKTLGIGHMLDSEKGTH